MSAKPKTEWRVVCARFGQAGHSSHKWVKKDRKKAEQSVLDLNHHAEIHPTHFYAKEAPYVVQSREVSKWAPYEQPDSV